MKLIDVIKAYNAARVLSLRKLEKHFGYAICKTLHRLEDDYDFYARSEHNLVKQYGKCDEKGEPIMDGNKFSYRDSNAALTYAAARKELDNMEIELDEFKRPHALWPDDIEPEYIMALEPFIDFAEPEE